MLGASSSRDRAEPQQQAHKALHVLRNSNVPLLMWSDGTQQCSHNQGNQSWLLLGQAAGAHSETAAERDKAPQAIMTHPD